MPFRYFESTDHCLLVGDTQKRLAVWEKPVSGDKFAPYKDPAANLDLIRCCSDFDYYAAASGFPTDVTISHPAASADAGTEYSSYPASYPVIAYNLITTTDYELATHGLGYEPNFMVAVDGVQYPAGCPIQVGPAGARRSICFWVDTDKIYVTESVRPGPNGLPAIDVTYHVTVFRAAGPVAGAPLYTASASRVRLGYGNIDTDEVSMREPDTGETVYAIPTGETMALINGRARFALPNGSVFDIGPLIGVNTYNGAFFGGPSKGMAI